MDPPPGDPSERGTVGRSSSAPRTGTRSSRGCRRLGGSGWALVFLPASAFPSPKPSAEVFEGAEFVRLRSVEHGTFLHAAEDGRAVRLDARSASPHAATGGGPGVVLLHDAHGRFLRANWRHLPEVVSSPSARVFAAGVGVVPPGEMAMSEEYTCVISRGPNPRTTHIFDDCIVESCGDLIVDKSDKATVAVASGAAVACDFLSFCHACNKQLGHGNDILIYQ